MSSADDGGIDLDGDSLFDLLRVTLNVSVRSPETFGVAGGVFADSTVLATASRNVTLSAGNHPVTLDFSGRALRRSGRNGPYRINLALKDSTGSSLSGLVHLSHAYSASQFETSLL